MITNEMIEAAKEKYATHGQTGHLRALPPSDECVVAMLTAALALLPGEPVGYIVKSSLELLQSGESSGCVLSRHEPAKIAAVPLYAAPAPQPVSVKALEWVEWNTGHRGWQVDTVLGQYQVCYLGEYEEWQTYCPGKLSKWRECFSRYPSSDAAKAAAQADYEARIRSALSSPVEGGTEQCCMCGKNGLSTVEGDGGTECELSDGRWTCSAECYDRAIEPVSSIEIEALRVENERFRTALEQMRPHVDKISGCIPINDEMGRVVVGQTEAAKSLAGIFDALQQQGEGK